MGKVFKKAQNFVFLFIHPLKVCLTFKQVQSDTLLLIVCVKLINETNFETRTYINDRMGLGNADLQTELCKIQKTPAVSKRPVLGYNKNR